MCKNISYLLLVVFIFFCGCASKMDVLNKDNIKVPEHVYTSRHIPTGLTIQAFVAGMSANGDYAYPEKYLELENSNKVNELNYGTIMISGRIRINNPNKQSYTIKTVSKKKYEEIKYPFTRTHVIYKGDVEQKVFTFDEEVDKYNPLVNYRIIVESGDAEVFSIQTKYKIE